MDSNQYELLLHNLFDGIYTVDRERKITFWSPSAERITGYGSPEVIGRRCADDVLVHVDADGCCLCETGCPLKQVISEGRQCEREVFMRHRDGHRVPVNVRTLPLKEEDGGIAGAAVIFRENPSSAATRRLIEELRKLALLDAVTGLPNRRYVERTVRARLGEMRRYGQAFGTLFIDIDDFKQVNDSLGHDTGDEVLRMVARTLAHSMRSFDVVGRWGGEEFVAVIVNVTAEELAAVAEKLRALVEQSELPEGAVRVTVSLGASLARPEDTEETLLERIDRLMYKSKTQGKNRVTAEFPQTASSG